MAECKPVATPMTANKKLTKNDGATKVDETLHRKLVDSFIYLSITRISYILSEQLQGEGSISYNSLCGKYLAII